MLLHISYASTLRDAEDADRIVAQAQTLNPYRCVGGCIAFDANHCVQILEGKRDDVEAVYERIRQDTRHFGVVELVRAAIGNRRFDRWGMARRPLTDVYAMSEAVAPHQLPSQSGTWIYSD